MRNSVSKQIDSIPGSKKRFKSIDFVKGIAMLMVILVHYEQMFNIAGFFACLQQGCAIFFVASGFGITSLINNKYGGSLRKDNVSKFYLSRVKALYAGWLL
ncbi:MAG: acyltransferase family protein, partial [Clostridia bacterium]|nr:acyltransferase family protein [Clostridia bacterium]